jgi:uncharacterized protein (TIGR03437 family)
MLNGPYFVRQILTLPDPNTSAFTRAVSLLGTMTFDGKGNYSFSGQELDSSKGTTASSYTMTGTYQLSSSGLLQLVNPIDNTDTEFGGVGSANEIVASATEGMYDDIFIAIPMGPASGVTGTYQTGFIDFLGGNASNVRDGYFNLAVSGSGSFGNVTVTGAAANQKSTQTTQMLSNVTYSFSGNNGTVTFPTASSPATALVSGAKSFAVSTDGNILVGGNANGFDLFVGVKAGSSVSNSQFSGTYFTGALENDVSGSCSEPNCIDSFYGSVAANGQGAGTSHSRLVGFNFAAYDYTSDVSYAFPSGGSYNNGAFQLMLGANGEAVVEVGTGQFYSLTLVFQANPAAGTGVSLSPVGVVNAASFAPITNSIAPGEYVALFGSNLASNGNAATIPLSTTLGGSMASLNSTAMPLYATSAGLITAITPNATPINDLAAFQVSNASKASNTVTLYTASTAPGVFTSTANGIGPADVFHSNYTYVTQSSPAVAGETLLFYATGLGATNPIANDGAAAPSNPPAMVVDPNLSVDIFDAQGNVNNFNVAFAGLVPGLVGVYQINFTVPSGVASGIGYLEVNTTDGLTSQAKIYMK